MVRTRNVPVAIKTTRDVKDKLDELVALMSKEAGFKMTQTQVIEKLISDGIKAQRLHVCVIDLCANEEA